MVTFMSKNPRYIGIMAKRRAAGEGSIYQDARGYWNASVFVGRDPDGKALYKKVSRKTEKLAAQELKKLNRMLDAGELKPPSKGGTIADLIHDFVKHAKRSLAPNTATDYERTLVNFILPEFGKEAPNALKAINIRKFNNRQLEEGRSVSHVVRCHKYLQSVLRQAVRDEIIARNPCDQVKLPQLESEEVNPWTFEEAQRFLDVAQGGLYFEFYYLALTTGMRFSELAGLQWQHVDFEGSVIRVRGQHVKIAGKRPKGERAVLTEKLKTKASRRDLDVSQDVINVFKPLAKEQGYVFMTSAQTPINPRNIRRQFDALQKKAKVRRIRFHDLRHTHASLLLAQGMSMEQVAARLGHADSSVTARVYAHLYSEQRKQMALPDSRLFSAPAPR
jgi:integrase